MFAGENIFYSMGVDIIYDDTAPKDVWRLSDTKAIGLKQHKLCVIDLSTEYWPKGVIEHVYAFLTKHDINFIILSYNPDDHGILPNLFYFPYFYYFSMKILKAFDKCGSRVANKKYKWSCYNRNPRPHRIYNYVYSRTQPHFEFAAFSMINGPECTQDYNVLLAQNVLEEWQVLKQELPTETLIFGPVDADFNSYIHLITETTVTPGVFITEKTWIPIISERMFLLFGNPGSVNFLRSMGVDVFDDLIDHSYDQEPNWQLRCHKIHDELGRLMSKDLQKFHKDTQARRTANRNKFLSGIFDRHYRSAILKRIDEKLS